MRFSCWQQARARILVIGALLLLLLVSAIVALLTANGLWTMRHWRQKRRLPRFNHYLKVTKTIPAPIYAGTPGAAIHQAITGAYDAALMDSGFHVFSRALVFTIFTTFLLPMWSLAFATEGIGREREAGNLIWTLARPLPRWSVYLAKYFAVLPWALGFNLTGFVILCLLAGEPGRRALYLYWPAVVWGTLAFCSLFHLFGAWFRRPAVIAILYSFFLETLMGNMPGYLKRASISFYIRCSMFSAGKQHGVEPPRPEYYVPADGFTAWVVLAGFTIGLVLCGMCVFSRLEYRDQV